MFAITIRKTSTVLNNIDRYSKINALDGQGGTYIVYMNALSHLFSNPSSQSELSVGLIILGK